MLQTNRRGRAGHGQQNPDDATVAQNKDALLTTCLRKKYFLKFVAQLSGLRLGNTMNGPKVQGSESLACLVIQSSDTQSTRRKNAGLVCIIFAT
ncbi:hypothetical protein C0Q70_03015 [Pomacea canaliculata]|uniref:Uncharacterized protein n=1 Tax=Pomacea canaliculata TaxID=400727 RepID=A0A2T7PRK3_POMCA|nr:hypothetical protein C0Q70_03015 [Pomacea canaliculata]